MSLESDYNRERKRIYNLFRSLTKRGYIDVNNKVSDDLGRFSIPTISELKKSGKKITKRVATSIRRYTADWFYKNFNFVNPKTGKTISGEKGQAYERSQTAQKAAATRAQLSILQTILNEIESLPTKKYMGRGHVFDFNTERNILFELVTQNAYNSDGTTNMNYVRHIQQNYKELQKEFNVIIQDSEATNVTNSYISAANILNGGIITSAVSSDIEDSRID